MDIIRIEESGEKFGEFRKAVQTGSITTNTTVGATVPQLTALIEQIQSTYSQDIITIADNIEKLLLLTSNDSLTLDVNIQGISDNLQDIVELNNILRSLGSSVLVGESIIKVANKIEDVVTVSHNIDATKTVSYLALEILALSKIDKEIINMNQYVDKIYALHQKLSSITYLSDNLNGLISLANIPNTEMLNLIDNIPLMNAVRDMEVDLRALACNINLLRNFNKQELLDLLQHSYDLDIISKTRFRQIAKYHPIIDTTTIELDDVPSGDIGEIKLANYQETNETYLIKEIIVDGYTIDLENKKIIFDEPINYTHAYFNYITNGINYGEPTSAVVNISGLGYITAGDISEYDISIDNNIKEGTSVEVPVTIEYLDTNEVVVDTDTIIVSLNVNRLRYTYTINTLIEPLLSTIKKYKLSLGTPDTSNGAFNTITIDNDIIETIII